MDDSRQTFRLFVNGELSEFDVNLLSRRSKRVKALVKEGVYQARVDHPVSPEAAEAFIAACRIHEFDITDSIAFELLDLATEWQIPSLIADVAQYIKVNSLQRETKEEAVEEDEEEAAYEPSADDALGRLTTKLQAKETYAAEFREVAENINRFLKDERLLVLPLNVLFPLFVLADRGDINQELLASFVVKLMAKNPQAAVPLLLRINFEKLTPDQIEDIFQHEEVHNQSISFYVGGSFSADQNKVKRRLQGIEERLDSKLNEVKDELWSGQEMNEERKIYEQELGQLKQMLIDQQEQMKEIEEFRESVRSQRKQAHDEFTAKMAELKKKLDKQSKRANERKKQIDALKAQIRDELEDQVEKLKREIQERLEVHTEKNDTVRGEVERKNVQPRESLKTKVQRMRMNCKTIRNGLTKSLNETTEVKAALAAKMIRDFMRFDNFIRRSERRFSLFDGDEKILGLNPTEVKMAETFLIALDKKVDRLCPIRRVNQ